MTRCAALGTAAAAAALLCLHTTPLAAGSDVPPSPKASPASTSSAAKKPAPARPAAKAASPSPSPSASPSAHVYTNQDLPAREPEPQADKDGKPAPKKADRPEKRAAAPSPVPTVDPQAAALDAERQRRLDEEAMWKERANEARNAVGDARTAVRKLQDQAGQLAMRIRLSTDTNEILRLRAEQQQVQQSAEAGQADLDRANKRLEDLQEEARRAGVPPGWIREP